ncbi:MAG: CPBP family intramembrane metalloprotease, partial [Deltaproteobacteria bacterium]|nr:CPBP family intramembrane metalloprotease [Deltaproteobacteria bacterium]
LYNSESCHARIMKMPAKVLIAAIVEIAYAVFTRTWLHDQLNGATLELAVTAVRLVTVALYWALFRQVILSRIPRSGTVKLPLVIVGAACALAIPFLFQGWSLGGGLGTALVFALTSVVVGLREELLYRAVLINLLEPKIGTVNALLFSTGLFVIYHYGALPTTVLVVTEVVCLSLVFGLIYVKSGTLVAVIAFHAVYDAIWCFGPYLAAPLPDIWRPAFLLPALIFVFLGTWRIGETSHEMQGAAQ